MGSAPWTPGYIVDGDFIVEGALGSGGMGTVYLMRSRASGRQLAVKKTRAPDPLLRRRFLAELRTWIDLPRHSHLAACRFVRTVDDDVLIFADYVEGGSLDDHIHEGRVTSLKQALDISIQFEWGLQALHDVGLIHRDVKPSNVLVADGTVKVADFGLTVLRDAPPSDRTYTPAYCSPEQGAGRPLDHRTDIWSWGLSVLSMFHRWGYVVHGQRCAGGARVHTRR